MHASDRQHRLQQAASHLHAGRADEAAAVGRILLARQGQDTEAMLIVGLALGLRDGPEPAMPLLAEVARRRPDAAHPCRDLAALLQRLGRADQVEPHYRAGLRHAPHDARLILAFAEHLHADGRPGDAADWLDRVPDIAAAQNLLGIIRAGQGRPAEAVPRFRQAVALDPDDAGARSNLGAALAVEGSPAEAFAHLEAALGRRPDNIQAHVNLGVALLREGRLAEGWPHLDWRLRRPGRLQLPAARLLPPLAADARLDGRTILVTHDEGLGDTLQFLRYVPLLAARGARVLAWLPDPLLRLVAGFPGLSGILTGTTRLPPFDWHCPLVRLGLVFGTTLDTIPPMPALAAEPALVASWAARLPRPAPAPGGARRVGLVWAGASRAHDPAAVALDRRRSVDPALLAPLAAIPGLCLVSLQMGPPAAQPYGMALADPMAAVADLADTAAIIAGLDTVVSVDTAVAHLAGAMGKPVLLLNRHDTCWRWLSGRADSPWYPSLRILRQPRPGDWAAVVADVARALR